MPHDILILGAGPAGLMCACHAEGKSVAVLEKNPSAGRKLRIAGSGRCNVTHAGKMGDFCGFYAEAARFVKPCLMAYTNQDLIRFFAGHGLRMTELNDGKIFPVTQRSEDVLAVLLEACRRKNVEIAYGQAATHAEFLPDEKLFAIKTETKTWHAKNLVISTGGKSYPTTGSTGDGYALAEALGHTVTEIRPALTPVYVEDYPFTPCAGISLENRPISVWRAGKKIASGVGDILFTHHGFSGPGILDFSRNVRAGDTLKIMFPGNMPPDVFSTVFLEELTQNAKKTLKNLLAQKFGLPERFTECLIKIPLLRRGGGAADGVVMRPHGDFDHPALTGTPPEEGNFISPMLAAWEIDKKTRLRLTEILTAHPFRVRRVGDFREAMCTRGGVNLSEINRQNMASRILPGLYFCGEVLDVDAATGGYNLQFAFSSGVAAARDISTKKLLVRQH